MLGLAAGLAGLGVLCLVAAASGRGRAIESEQLVPGARGALLLRTVRGRVTQSMLYGDEFFPFWERENTGDPESFANAYVDLCIRKLGPCPGVWDSPAFSGEMRDTYDEDHPYLGL